MNLPWTVPGGQQVVFSSYSIASRIGGDAEVIDSGTISSENFVTGTSGWRIDGDGNAEFNDITVRGTLETGSTGDAYISISDGDPNQINFYTGDVEESQRGYIDVGDGNDGDDFAFMNMVVPNFDPTPTDRCYVDLRHYDTDARGIGLYSDTLYVEGLATFNDEVHIQEVETGTPTWQNGWVDFGGSFSVLVYKDSAGFVHVEGLARNSNGNAATDAIDADILSLPAGFRPPADHRIFACPDQTGALIRVDVNTTGMVTITATWGGSVADTHWLDLQPIIFFAGY